MFACPISKNVLQWHCKSFVWARFNTGCGQFRCAHALFRSPPRPPNFPSSAVCISAVRPFLVQPFLSSFLLFDSCFCFVFRFFSSYVFIYSCISVVVPSFRYSFRVLSFPFLFSSCMSSFRSFVPSFCRSCFLSFESFFMHHSGVTGLRFEIVFIEPGPATMPFL